MSPFDEQGRWSSDEALSRAEVSPAVFSATTTGTAFETSNVEELQASLGVHAFLQTNCTGTNNDLDYITRTPGVQAEATATTTMTGANNDLVFTGKGAWKSARGNGKRIRILDTSGQVSTALSVALSGNEVLITPATNASGVISSTAAQVTAAIAGNATVFAVVSSANSGADTGAGVVTPLDAAVLAGGVSSTGITIAYIDPAGNNATLGVVVTGEAIVVNLGTGSGGAITSTASQVQAAVRANAAANGLVVVNNKGADTGAGVVTALVAAPLAAQSGTTPTADVKLETSGDAGASYDLVKAFAQVTTTLAGYNPEQFGPLGDRCRWVFTLGGGTPIYAFSIGQSKADIQ